MRYLEKEIVNGRNPEENIPQFIAALMDIYHKYSYVKLSLNYFTYYEMAGETKITDERLVNDTKKLNAIVKKLSSEDESELDCAVKETEVLRNDVIQMMNGLTAWIDIFNIYEYCLNRVEYQYKDGEEFLHQSDEELTRDILKYILSDKDHVVMNGKISETVRQLPIRMTKSRFFELLKEGMKVYKDSEKGSVNDFLYMLRTVSTLDISDEAFKISDDLNEIYREFSNTDFAKLEEEGYNQLRAKLNYAVEYIQNAVDYYMMLAENINDIYVILISSKAYLINKVPNLLKGYEKNHVSSIQDTKVIENCARLVEKENQLFDGTSYEEICEEIEDGFLFLEGKQEKYSEIFQKYSYLTETICQKDSDIAILFSKIDKLVSGSVFAGFEDEDELHEMADMQYITEEETVLEQELTDFFKSHNKNINRAVMAHVLAELPVFFNNVEEIKNYIYAALTGCRDKAEKAAVTEIFLSMINEEQ
ncbi:MAG: hypothetical protein SPF70_12275 [Lachnospiraceae bacterium]|nr:hypothetical protein [Lachnospiraceae bacterium]